MNDDQLLRYSRHLLLPEIGIEGQQRLANATILIAGLGGLGSPAALYLAASGAGRLLLADHDTVDLSNLQRQILHGTNDVQRAKPASAADRIAELNPDVSVELLHLKLEGTVLDEVVAKADVVIDATDNFASRFAINDACVAHGIPLVSGAAIRHAGQVSVFGAGPGGPCYRCLYPDENEVAESCSETGVFAPLLGIIGSMQAAEAIKIIVGFGETLQGRLLSLDSRTMHWRESKLVADPQCPVCGSGS